MQGRLTALTFSRRIAAFMIPGESGRGWIAGDAVTRVAASTCQSEERREFLRGGWCPGAVSSSALTAPKIETLPAAGSESATDDSLLAHTRADEGVFVTLCPRNSIVDVSDRFAAILTTL